MAEKLAPEKRHIFSHNGQTVFEWDQTLEEVNIYIKLPPNVHPKQFYCKIQSKHVEVGIKGNPPYLNHDLTSPVKTDCSFWTLEDDIMHITLQKRDKGQTWSSPIQGQGQLDPYMSDMEQKRLMLQRFQEENPGFDFSQAQFTGNCPDPRTFMGGIREDKSCSCYNGKDGHHPFLQVNLKTRRIKELLLMPTLEIENIGEG